MNNEQIRDLAIEALEDLKAKDLITIDVRELTGVTDFMVICTGSSNRHVKSLANNVYLDLKRKGLLALSVEGEAGGEWVLVDLGDVVVHVMLQETRDFYELEKLWSEPAA